MFAFYDLETSGTSPAFDQPLQFAGILTNDDLEEVERVNIRCRLSPHILPAPWAMAVTGVTPDMLADPSLPSAFEFAQEVKDLISRWGPATWVGFNSIAFDEQMLRQMFYQNLHPDLYSTQINGNDRLDIMKLVYATWVLANDALAWPTDENDKVIYKLDRLAPANGFVSDNFHDALADVEATIHIAKLIRDRAPAVWEQSLRNRSKNDVLDLLSSGQVLTLIERFGAAPPRAYLGAYAGQNPQNQNSIAYMDLELVDPKSLDPVDSGQLADAVNASPKQVRTIAINNAPNLFQMEIDTQVVLSRANELQNMHELHEAIGQALADRYQGAEEPEEIEKQIYAGFFSYEDKNRLIQFQKVDWLTRIEIAQEFSDRRLRWLSSKLLYLNKPELLSQSARDHWQQSISQRWQSNDPKAEWTTFSQANKQLSEIEQQGAIDTEQYNALKEFYGDLARKFSP
ncbi:exodeoxyribonuclease I [Sneathiella sp. P13V-1]|uniref:exonuclease domain-containing protein n=1 Tax=Sneathiella sp. P13V-1 TaxID=2697366 RepID=UPI00187B5093|nr:exonuclease domain-containing protein [Sneathiella sp. P13V-1]MBE7635946.1 exodeoxyribonuclease I [Sneathiella sp. P13V-1]